MVMPVLAAAAPYAGAAIGAIGGVLGGVFGNSAQDRRQEDAQWFNTVESAYARQFNAEQAGLNREFQATMSNTAYRRAMEDMKLAGLNPILAYAQGGAGGTPGATASSSQSASPSPQPVINTFASAVSSAAALAHLDNLAAQAEKTRAETRNVNTDTRQREGEFIERDEHGNRKPASTYSALERERRANYLHYEANLAIEQAYLSKEQQELVKQEIRNAIEQNRRIRAETRDTNANALLRELAATEARNVERFHRENPNISTYGTGLKYLGEALNSAGRLKGLLQWR